MESETVELRGVEDTARRRYKDAEEFAEAQGRSLLTAIRNNGLASPEAHRRYHEYLTALDVYKVASRTWHRAHEKMTSAQKGIRSWR